MHLSRAKAEPDYTLGTGSTAVNHATIPSHGHHGVAEKAENKQTVVLSARRRVNQGKETEWETGEERSYLYRVFRAGL